MSRSPDRMKRRGKSAFAYFAAVVIVSCYLAPTIDCLRLKKTERREGRKELDAAQTTAFHEGRILFGRTFEKGPGLESQDIDGTKKSNDSSEDDSSYQADAVWSMVPVQDISSREASWKRMTPSLQCGGDRLKFRAVGPGVTHFKIEQGDAPPMPLSQVPPSCGYSMQRNPFALVMQVPYDGCNMVQDGGNYMLPMRWQGVPVSLVCPKPQLPSAPQMLVYPQLYPQMPAQQHYSKIPDMSHQSAYYPQYPQQQQYPSYPQHHQQQQHPSYPQHHQQQQYPSYPQHHQQQQQQQYPSYPQQQQQQYPSYPKQHQQYPSYPQQQQQFPHFPEPSKAQTPGHPVYPFYPYYYPSFQWPQKGPQQTTTTPTTTHPTTTHSTTTTPTTTTTTTAATSTTTTTTPPPTTTTQTTTKSTSVPQLPYYPYFPPYPPYPMFPPFVPPYPQPPTTKPTTTTTTTKAPVTASPPPPPPPPPVFPPHFHPHVHNLPFPIPPNYPPPPPPPPYLPMFRP